MKYAKKTYVYIILCFATYLFIIYTFDIKPTVKFHEHPSWKRVPLQGNPDWPGAVLGVIAAWRWYQCIEILKGRILSELRKYD